MVDSPHRRHERTATLLSLLAITFFIAISLKLVTLPLNRAVESRYCLEYFRQHDPSVIDDHGVVPEQDCKVGQVQQQVGFMIGALETVTAGCDIISAAPLAYLADSIGRSRVLMLNISAMLIRLGVIVLVVSVDLFPTWLVLLGPVLGIFGGSTSLNTSLVLTLAVDLAQTEAERSTYISWLYCLPFIASMLGPAVAAITMTVSTSIPTVLALALNLLALSVTYTISARPMRRPEPARRTSNPTAETALLPDPRFVTPGQHPLDKQPLLQQLAILLSPETIQTMWYSYASLLKSKANFRILLFICFLTGAATSSTYLLPLLLSTRFGWTLAQVGVIFSCKAVINLTMSIGVVPAYATKMKSDPKKRFAPSFVDRLGGIVSLYVSALGAVFIAFALSKTLAILAICVYAIGSVVGIFIYALARSTDLHLLDETNDAQGYVLILLVHTIGGFIGNPIMAWAWAAALDAREGLQGLPFVLSGLCYLAAIPLFKQLR